MGVKLLAPKSGNRCHFCPALGPPSIPITNVNPSRPMLFRKFQKLFQKVKVKLIFPLRAESGREGSRKR